MVVEWEDALIRGLFRAHGCIMHFINKPPFDAHFDARSCLMTPKVTSRCNRAFSSNLMFPVVTPSCMKLHKAKKRIPKPCVGCSNHLGSAKYENLGHVSGFSYFRVCEMTRTSDEMGFGEGHLPHQSCIVNKPFVKIQAMQRTTASGVTGSQDPPRGGSAPYGTCAASWSAV